MHTARKHTLDDRRIIVGLIYCLKQTASLCLLFVAKFNYSAERARERQMTPYCATENFAWKHEIVRETRFRVGSCVSLASIHTKRTRAEATSQLQ